MDTASHLEFTWGEGAVNHIKHTHVYLVANNALNIFDEKKFYELSGNIPILFTSKKWKLKSH